MMETIMMTAIVLSVVAFFTLAERKLMAINHNRKGPNKATMKGALQPMSDAVKLLTKEWMKMKTSSKSIYAMSPTIGLASYIMVWLAVPNPSSMSKMNLTMLYLAAVMSATIVFSMSTGWSSNSKYAILGSYRSTAQAISYEISMAIFMLAAMTLVTSLNTMKTKEMSMVVKLVLLPFLSAWTLTVLAETSRTPFDFTESESELVSGFNTEYYGTMFSIFFIAEYLALIFMSALTAMLFINSNTLLMVMVATTILMTLTTIRMTLPRSRYDKLMNLAWVTVMPVSIIALSMIIIMSNQKKSWKL